MTIATELQDLQQNVEDLGTAIIAKGGTVTGDGLSTLVADVASIPSGGGVEITGYGRLEFYKNIITEFSLSGEGCEVDIIDQELFETWYNETGVRDLQYENGGWYYNDPQTGEPIEVTLSEIGLQVTLLEPDFAFIFINANTIADKTSGIDYVDLDANTFPYLTELNDYDVQNPLVIDDKTIYPICIRKYYFGPDVTITGSNFCAGVSGDFETDTTYGYNVTSIGAYSYIGRGVLDLPNLTTIGNNCSIYSQEVKLPKLTAIPNNTSFRGSTNIVLENVTTVGNSFTATDARRIILNKVTTIGDSFYAPYATEVTLPNVETIGNSFLQIDGGTYTACGNYLRLQISKVVTIGNNFLANTSYRGVNCTFPNTIFRIGTGFMADMKYLSGDAQSYCCLLRFDCRPSVLDGSEGALVTAYMQEAGLLRTPLYGCGVGIYGTYKNEWVAALPTKKEKSIYNNAYRGRTTYVAAGN